MGVARLCAIQLTQRFRLGIRLHSKYYCSASQTSELKESFTNQGDKDTDPPNPANDAVEKDVTDENSSQGEDPPDMVDMWNKDAIAGPEWNGPRGYEPTKYGDWSSKGRVSDF